jgi:hypothetical protein
MQQPTVETVVEMPKGVQEWMSFYGLGTPTRRALLAATVAAAAVYVMKPSIFFTEDGKMRTQHIPYLHPEKLPEDPVDDSTNVHFLMIPAGAAVIAGVFL